MKQIIYSFMILTLFFALPSFSNSSNGIQENDSLVLDEYASFGVKTDFLLNLLNNFFGGAKSQNDEQNLVSVNCDEARKEFQHIRNLGDLSISIDRKYGDWLLKCNPEDKYQHFDCRKAHEAIKKTRACFKR